MRILCSSVVAAMVLVGCCTPAPVSEGDNAMASPSQGAVLVNTMCPVNPKAEVDPDVSVTYAGAKVGFCCNRCLSRWKNMEDEARKTALAAVHE